MTYTKEQQQEILNISTAGVLAQGGGSLDPMKGGCAYRGGGGRKCGIGHLMSDEQYEKLRSYHNDGLYVTQLCRMGADFMPAHLRPTNPHKDESDMDFLKDIQWAHDSAAGGGGKANDEKFLPRFKHEVRLIAGKYDLEIPEGVEP